MTHYPVPATIVPVVSKNASLLCCECDTVTGLESPELVIPKNAFPWTISKTETRQAVKNRYYTHYLVSPRSPSAKAKHYSVPTNNVALASIFHWPSSLFCAMEEVPLQSYILRYQVSLNDFFIVFSPKT